MYVCFNLYLITGSVYLSSLNKVHRRSVLGDVGKYGKVTVHVNTVPARKVYRTLAMDVDECTNA